MVKRALVVAINDYQGTANDLPSCLEDANQFLQLIRSSRYGFAETDIKVLRDAQATVQNVEDGLRWLFNDAKEGDILVFFYSGHGYAYPKKRFASRMSCPA